MYKIMDTMKIFNSAMKDNDYSFDIYFRMAVIEKYLAGDEKIWDLYFEMQKIRCLKIKEVPIEMVDHKNDFIKLIKDIRENGYNLECPILLNKDGLIIDGAHRMACAIYFCIPSISVYTMDEYYNFVPAEYTKEWFEINGLNECITFGEFQKKRIRRRQNV